MSEIEVYRPSGVVAERDIVDGWITIAADVSKLADYIAETDFVPKALRNRPAAVAACILTGRELGIGPMQSLKSIHMVQGTPGLSAEYKRARALEAGHEIVFDETNSHRCVVRGRRAGTDRWVTVTWDMDMARRAKLSGKDIWQAYPQRMLQARASGELCDILFPDASLGLATTEVLQDGGVATVDGAVVDAASGEITAGDRPDGPKPRTAQRKTSARTADRKTAAAAAPATADAGQPAGNEPASAAAAAPLPPLPGEEPDPTAGSSASSGTGSRPKGTSGPSQSSASTSEPDETDYDTEGTVTPQQLTAIWTVLSTVYHFDKDDRDSARDVCAHITGHSLASSKDLSRNEAKAVLDTLAHWQKQAEKAGEDPRPYMQAVTAGAVSDGE